MSKLRYYTSLVSVEIIEKLYDVGCPNLERFTVEEGKVQYSDTTYADIFDGLIKKGLCVAVHPRLNSCWCADVEDASGIMFSSPLEPSFKDAANCAIQFVIKVLEEKKKK